MIAECECGRRWPIDGAVAAAVRSDHGGGDFTLGLMCSECAGKLCKRCNGGKGGTVYISAPRWVKCVQCNGSGQEPQP